MRGRQILYPNIRPDSNRTRRRRPRPWHAARRVGGSAAPGPGMSGCGCPLLIPAPAGIMAMYTDWGNLKVVSCVAWLNGVGPGSSTVQQGMGALGASIFRLRQLSPRPL